MDLPKEEQFWKRKELPSFFDDIDYDKMAMLFSIINSKPMRR